MNGDSWIHAGDLARAQQHQARSIADRLGHRMTSWVAVREERALYMARCVVCWEAAIVAVRNLGRAPISGVAVSLHCRRPTASAAP